MGLFTTIIDPESGLEVQIKVGGDCMHTYKIGEIINELNGCYSAVGDGKDGELEHYWVVVKESRAVAIRPRSEDPDRLCLKFGIPVEEP